MHIALLSIWFLVCVALAMTMIGAYFYGVYLAGVAFFSLPTQLWVSVVVALFAVGGCKTYIDLSENTAKPGPASGNYSTLSSDILSYP